MKLLTNDRKGKTCSDIQEAEIERLQIIAESNKIFEEVIELCRKKKQDLNNEQALALTLEKLKQPKKRRSRKINNNPQQVSRVIQ